MKKRVMCILGLILITLACGLPQLGNGPAASPTPLSPNNTLSPTLSGEIRAPLMQTLAIVPSVTSTAATTAAPAATKILATTPAVLEIGSTRIAEIDGMKQVYVPAGEFKMGSSEAQYQAAVRLCINAGGKQDDCIRWESLEKPQHTVYLDAYWIDQTEVTNAMFAKCASAGACQATDPMKLISHQYYYSRDQFMDYPMIYVDWNQAQAYCSWAGRSLPTEAQWEKAARGTDGRTYPWGEGIDCQKANYNGCMGDTTRVGSYPAGASPYGALDMAGNVQEWVADWYGAGYYGSSPKRNPTGPASGDTRVLRGGSWDVDIYNGARSAYRTYVDSPALLSDIGFRCAATSTPPQ